MKGFLIGEAAELLGVHPATLRDYERRGIIPPAKRHLLGWRMYDPDAIRELQRRLEPKGNVSV